MLGPMTLFTPARPASRTTSAPTRTLFVVSRNLPERYNSLAYAFDGDRAVRVIFDRRRGDRRQRTSEHVLERRREDRRSADREWTLRSAGWIQIDPE